MATFVFFCVLGPWLASVILGGRDGTSTPSAAIRQRNTVLLHNFRLPPLKGIAFSEILRQHVKTRDDGPPLPYIKRACIFDDYLMTGAVDIHFGGVLECLKLHMFRGRVTVFFGRVMCTCWAPRIL